MAGLVDVLPPTRPPVQGPLDPGPYAKAFGGGLGILPSPMFFQGSANAPAPVAAPAVPAQVARPVQGPQLPSTAALVAQSVAAGDAAPPVDIPGALSHYVSPGANRMVNAGATNLGQGNIGVGVGQILGGGLGQAAYMAATPAADTVKAIGALGAGVGHFAANVGAGLMSDGTTPVQLPAQVATLPAHPSSTPTPVLHDNQLVVRNPDGTHSLLPQFSRTAPTAAEAAAYAASQPSLPTNEQLATSQAGTMRVAGDAPYTGATAGGGLVAGRYVAPVPAVAPTRAIPGTPLSERELAAVTQLAPKGTPIDFLQRMPHGTAGQLARLGLLTNQRGAQVTTQGVEDVQTAKNTVTGSLQKQVNDLQKQLLADPNNADLKGRYQGAVDLQARTLGTLYYPQGFLAGGMGGFGGTQ